VKSFILILVFVASAPYAIAQQAKEWLSYTSPEGRYSVSLPDKPTLSTQEAASGDGNKVLQYFASAAEAEIVYQVAYFDLMPGQEFSADAFRDGVAGGERFSLLNEMPVRFAGYDGRQLKVQYVPQSAEAKAAGVNPILLRTRYFSVDRRVYVVQVIYPSTLDGERIDTLATKFFDSFQLTKN
jgi:hypothetical protein